MPTLTDADGNDDGSRSLKCMRRSASGLGGGGGDKSRGPCRKSDMQRRNRDRSFLMVAGATSDASCINPGPMPSVSTLG